MPIEGFGLAEQDSYGMAGRKRYAVVDMQVEWFVH